MLSTIKRRLDSVRIRHSAMYSLASGFVGLKIHSISRAPSHETQRRVYVRVGENAQNIDN